MHGGLSPDLNSMEQIRRVMRPTDVSFRFRLPHTPFLGPRSDKENPVSVGSSP